MWIAKTSFFFKKVVKYIFFISVLAFHLNTNNLSIEVVQLHHFESTMKNKPKLFSSSFMEKELLHFFP